MTSIDNKNKNAGLFTGLLVLIIAIGVALYWLKQEPAAPEKVATQTQVDASAEQGEAPDENTLSTHWQWQEADDSIEPEQDPEYAPDDSTEESRVSRISEASVYSALQAVRVDAQGELILDNEALEALNDVFQSQEIALSEEDLGVVKQHIRNGLPGSIGEQTAEIVSNYYQLLQAEKEFNAIYEPSMDPDNAEERYAELVALRELYMGHEVADSLFATSNANARYMFSAMSRELEQTDSDGDSAGSDPSDHNSSDSSDSSDSSANSDLQQAHQEQTLGIDDWHNRLEQYQEQKQIILEAAISDNEKSQQLQELLAQHFDANERDRIRHLDLDAL